MNRHIGLVAVQVGELDHFLWRAVHRGANQSAELAHTQVLMNDVVALLNLVEFLERKGQLARAGTVALEVILVETVKNLVVGEDAHLQVIVHKALVQCAQHGLKGDGVTAVFKDVAQALNLLGTVTQDEQPVTTRQEVGERLPDEVKVLVIDALGLAVQRQPLDTTCGSGLAIGVADAAQLPQALQEQVGINHLVHSLGVTLVGDKRTHRHSLTGNLADARFEPLFAAAQHDGVIAHIVDQRHIVLTTIGTGTVVQDADVLQVFLAQLRLDVEGAYRVNVVAPKVDAVRQLVAVGEHVKDGAAHAELTWLIHIVGCREAQFSQTRCHLGQVGGTTRTQLHGARLHILAAAHTLGQRLGIGHHPAHHGVVKPAVQHLGAQNLIRRIHLAVFDVALVARRKNQHMLVASQLTQVVVHVSGFIQIVHHNQIGT